MADAAHVVAYAWARPLEPARHGRAVSQLYSVLRDLGIATRGLARYQITDIPADPVSPDFPRHVDASARWLLNTCESLDGVLAAEGLGSLPDPDEPGAALCRAARNAILAWRQPSGTSADRDITVKRFITATGFLSAATLGLATYAPRRRVIDLHAVCAGLAEVTAYLTAAIQAPAEDASPGHGTEPAQPRRPGTSCRRATRTVRAPDPAVPLNPGAPLWPRTRFSGDLMSTWTPEAIRALGVNTDLPTLGKIFGISRARAYQMAHTGEWEQAGIRIVPLGSKYVVAVQSILEVLGHGDAEPGAGTGQHGNGQLQSAGNAADDAITGPSGPAAAWNLR